MSGDGVSAELSGGIKIPVTVQLQCWAAGERDIEGRREREMTETWEKRRKWNKWQSEWREKEGGDVEWILEIGAGEIDMKTERIDPDLILENHMVISSSTESWTGEKSLSLLPDPTKPSLPQLTSAQFQWLSLLQTKTSATLTVCRICSAEPKALKKSSSKIKVKFQSDFRPLSGAMYQRLHIHPTLHAVEHVFVTKKKKKTRQRLTNSHKERRAQIRRPPFEKWASPSSLHSSGGLAFFASRGSNHDVVLVLWLQEMEEMHRWNKWLKVIWHVTYFIVHKEAVSCETVGVGPYQSRKKNSRLKLTEKRNV